MASRHTPLKQSLLVAQPPCEVGTRGTGVDCRLAADPGPSTPSAVDGWLRVRAPAQTGVLVKALRAALDAALQGAVRASGQAVLDASGPGAVALVEVLVAALDHEEAAQRWEH